jgi:hypothetical protein
LFQAEIGNLEQQLLGVMSGVADAAQRLRLILNPVLKILQIAISVDLGKLVTLSE